MFSFFSLITLLWSYIINFVAGTLRPLLSGTWPAAINHQRTELRNSGKSFDSCILNDLLFSNDTNEHMNSRKINNISVDIEEQVIDQIK